MQALLYMWVCTCNRLCVAKSNGDGAVAFRAQPTNLPPFLLTDQGDYEGTQIAAVLGTTSRPGDAFVCAPILLLYPYHSNRPLGSSAAAVSDVLYLIRSIRSTSYGIYVDLGECLSSALPSVTAGFLSFGFS